MVLRTLGYVLGAESALLLLPLLVAALYREDPVPFLIPLLALLFFIPSVVYGRVSGTYKNEKEVSFGYPWI